MHKSGFVNIIGLPNVGKSTLMNALIGQKLSIISHKAQTTRKRILGILNHSDYQVIFNDTPGILEPHYKMQEQMNVTIKEALNDADIVLFIIEANMNELAAKAQLDLIKTKAPIFLIVNKIDQLTNAALALKLSFWNSVPELKAIFPISAIKNKGLEPLLENILNLLPEHDAYYDKEDISDRNTRFFVSDLIRERIFHHYKDEIPYHSEVFVENYEEKPDIDVIDATIFVNRKSHKAIMIGKGGVALKKIGTEARQEIEKFIGKKVFLNLQVKIEENWIDNDKLLKRFGYKN
jgi:GTP-binding protein Era